MIWNKPIPKVGETRIVEHYAWFPRRIGDNIVWFEYYYSAQAFVSQGDQTGWVNYVWNGTHNRSYTLWISEARKWITPPESKPPELHVVK